MPITYSVAAGEQRLQGSKVGLLLPGMVEWMDLGQTFWLLPPNPNRYRARVSFLAIWQLLMSANRFFWLLFCSVYDRNQKKDRLGNELDYRVSTCDTAISLPQIVVSCSIYLKK